ncbi:MAG: ABC transporter permease subunit [Clostridiaceae bacterium]
MMITPAKAVSPRDVTNKSLWKRITVNYEMYLFLLPAIVYYIIFKYGPLYGLQIAFKDFNGALGFWGSKWVGLKYFNSFFSSYYFWPLLKNTLVLSVYSLIAGFPIPIILALMLNEVKNYKYKKFVQTVTYAPHFISTVVLVGTIVIVLSPTYGIVNQMLRLLGMEVQSFMTNPGLFRHIYVWSGIWQNTGWDAIIYLAALSAVDPEQHEAAIIDGASRIQRIWYINIPVLIPIMTILLILNAGNIMNIGFEKVLLMQNDLIMDVADVISTYVYRRGLLQAEFSFSAAIGLFNNAANFILLMIVNGITRKFGETSLF